MAISNINTTNIDTEFPRAGVDNDSQGFRDNYDLIKTGFANAKSEIEAIMETAILKGPIAENQQIVDNNMNGNSIFNVLLRRVALTLQELPANSPQTLDIATANYFKIRTITSNITLLFDNVNVSETVSGLQVILELESTALPGIYPVIELPAATYHNMHNVPTANTSSSLRLFTPGKYLYRLTTSNDGTSWFVEQLAQPTSIMLHGDNDPVEVSVRTNYFNPPALSNYLSTLSNGYYNGQRKTILNIGAGTVQITVLMGRNFGLINLTEGQSAELIFIDGAWSLL